MKEYDGVTLLKVTSVNGVQLKEPPTLRFSVFTGGALTGVKSGMKLKAWAYETGRYTGVPTDAFKYVPAVATTVFHFETSVTVLKKIDE